MLGIIGKTSSKHKNQAMARSRVHDKKGTHAHGLHSHGHNPKRQSGAVKS